MKLRTTLAGGVTGLITALVLAGCSSTAGSSSSSGMPGMDMPSASSTASSSTSTMSAHNAQDVMFAQMMAMHHLQAIEMSDMVLKKSGVDPKVTALAQKIKQAQQPEITELNGFLASWGQQKVTSADMGGMGGMSMGGGMMSQADMDKLEKASGSAASSLFLTQMVQHHTGAVTMAQDEVKKGKNPDAVALAQKIASAQTTEIATMKDLLKQI